MSLFHDRLLMLTIALALLLIGYAPKVKAEENGQVLTGLISEIQVKGNRLVKDQKILDNILSYQGAPLSREMILQDLQSIYKMGYFEAKSVEARPFEKEDGSVSLVFNVKENKPITDLIIYGNYAIDDIDAYKYFSDFIGKPENVSQLSAQIRELEKEYLTEGYIVARVKDIELDEAGTLKIYIDEGLIRDVVYKGNKKTKASYLNHLVTNTKPNVPYNEKLFAKDFRKLQGVGYFSNISRMVRPSDDNNGYTLEVQFKEKEKFTTLGIGGGINSSAGLFGNANMSFGNLKGKGESLNVNALLGSGFGAGSTFSNTSNFVRRDRFVQLGVSHTIPFYRGSRYSFTKDVNFLRGPNFNVDLSRQTSLGVGASLAKSIGQNHRFQLGAAASYIDIEDRDRREYINRVANNIIEVDGLTNKDVLDTKGGRFLGGRRGIARAEARAIRDEQIVNGFYVGLKPGYTYQNVDDKNRPRDGWRARFGLNPNLGFQDVDSFTKLNASVTRFFPMPWNSLFLVNARGGMELVGTIPQFAKYRLGTFSGVRGYRQFSELGVGNKLLISTAEFRTPIYNVLPPLKRFKLLKNIDFALFADAGLVGGNIRLNRLTDRLSQAAAVGFGIRVNIPLIGALRFDVGFPLAEALTGNNRLFRFNFGPARFI